MGEWACWEVKKEGASCGRVWVSENSLTTRREGERERRTSRARAKASRRRWHSEKHLDWNAAISAAWAAKIGGRGCVQMGRVVFEMKPVLNPWKSRRQPRPCEGTAKRRPPP